MNRLLPSLFILIMISGCLSSQQQPESFHFSTVHPAEAGMHSDSLQRVTDFLQTAVDSNKIPGAVAMVVKDGAIVYQDVVGMTDIETGTEIHIDNIFRIASMTKPITSVAALMLAERGALNVNDPVSGYIPEFNDVRIIENVNLSDTSWTSRAAESPVTIHHLLTHTSGIAYGFIDEEMNALYINAGVPDGTVMDGRDIEETMAALGNVPLKHEPGSRWTYGLSTDVLGRVVEVASGMPLDEFLQQEIFNPLGMNNTGFNITGDSQNEIVALYRNPEPNTLTKNSQLSIEGPDSLDMSANQMPEINYFSGGSGLMSTAEDYQRFLQTVLNKGTLGNVTLFGEQTAEWLMEHQIDELRLGQDGFSYGFMVTLPDGDLTNMRMPGRLQWGGLFQTHFWIDPARNSTVVLMTQVFPSQHQDELYNGFEERINGSFQ